MPSGYVSYGHVGDLPEPSGLRKAVLILFAVVTALCFVLGALAYQRGSVAEDFFNGSRPSADLNSSDTRVTSVVLLVIIAQVAAAIVLAVWSKRTVGNAQRRVPEVSMRPGMAAGGWFIPFGWWWVPWRELKQSVTASSGEVPASLRQWQVLFIAQGVLSYVTRNLGNFASQSDRGGIVSRLHTQGVIFVLIAAVLAVTTIRAAKAMPLIDAANASGHRR